MSVFDLGLSLGLVFSVVVRTGVLSLCLCFFAFTDGSFASFSFAVSYLGCELFHRWSGLGRSISFTSHSGVAG